ncbi:class III poly(R)-hydroxyalkanoic acid synthase subunit PhaC [Anaeromicrobium sediminis]|uniref:Poly(3-hydroxyalkanoate) polymerase subunit PhaC n=1 Tax=Anaeromicrobium sediminis TaxID=1478221 RepID=A0A267MHC8_9FIRM|nr:class III poly(R)-hydroxyalkanoic acid synthase subunit PhaC [Anaeromicrobium sediminis]PAB58969.1 class III poly(R)-hydroxyalkanoic acid synthase subunit PhaC [Anaeromicrobium sediminis]
MFPYLNIDVEKSIDEFIETNKKLSNGVKYMMDIKDLESDSTPKDISYTEDKMKLYHYKSQCEKVSKTPTLIVYALVNRQYMMDIQPDRSVIKKLLESGLDIYIIDWGYPKQEDMYLTMDDYINGYINNAVDHILKTNNVDKVNLMGICQGGTFSSIYSSLYPEKVKNLVTMVTPIDFGVDEGLLFKWGKHLNIDNMVDAYGVLPGDLMNSGYLMLKPFQLMLDKYVNLVDNIHKPDIMTNFIRMEKWIFDSPGQVGETLRQFVNDLYKGNKLVKGELKLGDKEVNLKNITMPLLNIYAEYDHLVPPSSSAALNDLVSSTDKELASFSVGHIGMYVSSKSQKEIAPKLANWLLERD